MDQVSARAGVRKKEETHMRAMVYHTYGSPDVLKLEEVQKPVPQDDEVLVQVHAASVNAADWHLMRGTPFLARFVNGLQKPKNTKLGADVAGRVEAVGRNVTQFQGGDEVFGCIPLHELGSFAEYVCAHEDALALKPAKMTFEQAAAVPLAAFTALQGLRDKGQIQLGQKVLVNGASGGVGTFAVQIAKSFGTEVDFRVQHAECRHGALDWRRPSH
jgi:NADPH:quinone reductase-like Zn-dependent oxidoreductase